MEKKREAEVTDQNQASLWGKRTWEKHSNQQRLVDSIVEEPFIGFMGFFKMNFCLDGAFRAALRFPKCSSDINLFSLTALLWHTLLSAQYD